MQTMHWYNPVTKEEEDVPAPLYDEQAIGMLSGHPDSDRIIEEYRRLSATHPVTVDALNVSSRFVFPVSSNTRALSRGVRARSWAS
jgi:hypothetical protein